MENMAVKNDAVVYVVQDDGKKNLLPAMKFGRLETLITGSDAQLYNTAPLTKALRAKLRYIRPDDFLLLVGDPVAIGIAAAIASEYTGGKLTFLKWDRQERMYYPLQVDTSSQLY